MVCRPDQDIWLSRSLLLGFTSKMDWMDRKMTPQSLGTPCNTAALHVRTAYGMVA